MHPYISTYVKDFIVLTLEHEIINNCIRKTKICGKNEETNLAKKPINDTQVGTSK